MLIYIPVYAGYISVDPYIRIKVILLLEMEMPTLQASWYVFAMRESLHEWDPIQTITLNIP